MLKTRFLFAHFMSFVFEDLFTQEIPTQRALLCGHQIGNVIQNFQGARASIKQAGKRFQVQFIGRAKVRDEKLQYFSVAFIEQVRSLLHIRREEHLAIQNTLMTFGVEFKTKGVEKLMRHIQHNLPVKLGGCSFKKLLRLFLQLIKGQLFWSVLHQLIHFINNERALIAVWDANLARRKQA